MKIQFNFDVFAVVLALVLLDLATLHPAMNSDADYAAGPVPAQAHAGAPAPRPLRTTVERKQAPRPLTVARPQHRVAAVALR